MTKFKKINKRKKLPLKRQLFVSNIHKVPNLCKYKEIAKILDLTVTNVGFILHAAMNELKNDLREALSR